MFAEGKSNTSWRFFVENLFNYCLRDIFALGEMSWLPTKDTIKVTKVESFLKLLLKPELWTHFTHGLISSNLCYIRIDTRDVLSEYLFQSEDGGGVLKSHNQDKRRNENAHDRHRGCESATHMQPRFWFWGCQLQSHPKQRAAIGLISISGFIRGPGGQASMLCLWRTRLSARS